MKSVGAGVQQETEKKQVPWRSTSVIGIFYFSGQEETTEVAGNRLGESIDFVVLSVPFVGWRSGFAIQSS